MKYAWFGRKASSYALTFMLGVLSYKYVPAHVVLLAIPIMLVFGWGKDTSGKEQ